MKAEIEALLRSWEMDQRREAILLQSIFGALDSAAAARRRMVDEMARAVIAAAASTVQDQTPPRPIERELEDAIEAMRSIRSKGPNGYQH